MAGETITDFAQFQENALKQPELLVAKDLILQHLQAFGTSSELLVEVEETLEKAEVEDGDQQGPESRLTEVLRQWKIAIRTDRPETVDEWSWWPRMRLRARQFTGVPDGQLDATLEKLQADEKKLSCEEEDLEPAKEWWTMWTGRQTTDNRPVNFEEEMQALKASCSSGCCNRTVSRLSHGKWLLRQLGSALACVRHFCDGETRREALPRAGSVGDSPRRLFEGERPRKSTSLPSLPSEFTATSQTPSCPSSSSRPDGRNGFSRHDLDQAAILRGHGIRLIGMADHFCFHAFFIASPKLQLDLCVTKPMSLPELLEEHAQDVQGSIQQRSYRLPPVLWLNLDRFAYDRVAKCGKKRQVKVTFPERLNTWMLANLEAKWAQRLRTCVDSRRSIVQELAVNRQFLQTTAEAFR
eukprot:symbB.v1.2.016067.t1/scaffold1176.1/size133768/10